MMSEEVLITIQGWEMLWRIADESVTYEDKEGEVEALRCDVGRMWWSTMESIMEAMDA